MRCLKQKTAIRLCLIFFLFSLISSCGYHNPLSSTLPKTSIYLAKWDNHTNILGLESIISQSITTWMLENKKLILVDSIEESDYQLSGKILSINTPGLSYGLFDRAIEVKAIIKLNYSFKDSKTGKILWQQKGAVFEKPYLLGFDAVKTLSNRKASLLEMANDLGERIFLQTINSLRRAKEQPWNL
jgi:hypothetical protein